jgi:hypothetical protein
LILAQAGSKHVDAKPLKGFGSAGVLEVVENDEGSTYRAVYTVRCPAGSMFFIASRRNIPRALRRRKLTSTFIKSRLKDAEADYGGWMTNTKGVMK